MLQLLQKYLPPALLAVACAQPLPSVANVVYTYTGRTYDATHNETPPADSYTSSMRVTGSFELASALPVNFGLASIIPLHFSFFDGRKIRSDTNGTDFVDFSVATDATGQLTEWIIHLLFLGTLDTVGDQTHEISLINFGIAADDIGIISECVAVVSGCSVQADFGSVSTVGTWQVTSTVPEPETMLLVSLALAGLGWSRRRK